jgi:cytochrome P450
MPVSDWLQPQSACIARLDSVRRIALTYPRHVLLQFALQFPYTCAVVSEALRLYPPGATTIREVPADGGPLQLGRYAVPAGSSVFVASYVMQRDPELWPRAAEFLPERWLPVRIGVMAVPIV